VTFPVSETAGNQVSTRSYTVIAYQPQPDFYRAMLRRGALMTRQWQILCLPVSLSVCDDEKQCRLWLSHEL